MKCLTMIVASFLSLSCYISYVRAQEVPEVIFSYQCPLWSNQCQITMYGYVLGIETYYPWEAEHMITYMNTNAYDMRQRFIEHSVNSVVEEK